MKCLVKGCTDTVDRDSSSELCDSCRLVLATGESSGTKTFIDELRLERDHFEMLVIDYECTERYGGG